MNNNLDFDVIVVGGGASGMMAAITAARAGRKVCIIEKNKKLGEKLKITGGGRCNVTNAEEDIHKLLSIYGDAKDFLYSPFSQFSNMDTFKFFEDLGLPLVVQARKRAFPHTEKAVDVLNVMEKEVKKLNIHLVMGNAVRNIIHTESRIKKVETAKGSYSAESFIISTGGLSHPETGSTGDGFNFLRDLGHKVKNPTPTIVPLAVVDNWVKELAGVSVDLMKITFYLDDKKSFSKKGKILFTHFGLSGPLILNSSAQVQELLYDGIVTAKIDLYPDHDIAMLDKKILKIFDENKNKNFGTIFKLIAPEGMHKSLHSLFTYIDFDTKVHSVSKEDRRKIIDTLKALPIEIEGLMGYERAVVADGGVTLTEIDMKTMNSKIIKNLFVTGDLLDINRRSGGFSLQLCWTTGYVAGKNA
ncbi:MAG: NAD(P)/FAD-dependent oxidoreductase [Candidatus Pacebacteria bacterium]|nr:NAD(P)/FAD-dependent oxidoreductase [Candidatus Paceibacterota bacterium]MBP9715589.1 NAD(P)/FAD-dependent oxidoreductase [Candidatus Paceibacterota bacterium]